MRAYINFGSSPGPFQTCAADDFEFRKNGVFILYASRWRKVQYTNRGRNYINVGGQPVRVVIE